MESGSTVCLHRRMTQISGWSMIMPPLGRCIPRSKGVVDGELSLIDLLSPRLKPCPSVELLRELVAGLPDAISIVTRVLGSESMSDVERMIGKV